MSPKTKTEKQNAKTVSDGTLLYIHYDKSMTTIKPVTKTHACLTVAFFHIINSDHATLMS